MILRRPALGTALAGVLAMAAAEPAQAQFRPEGRRAPQRRPAPAAAKPKKSPEAARAWSLRRALSRPEDVAALERAMELHRLREGGLEALRKALEKAAQDPRSARAGQLHLAWLLRSLGQRAAAEQTLRDRVAEVPTDSLAQERLARLLAEAQRPQEAFEHLERAAESASRSHRPQLLAELVQRAIALANREATRRYHQAWVQAVGAGSAGAIELPRQLHARGQLEWAAEEYERLEAQRALPVEERTELWSAWGATLVELGRFERALEVLSEAARRARAKPGLRAEVFEQQVRAHRGLGRLPQLAEQLENAGRRGFAQSLALGRVCEELGRLDCAEKALRRALRQRPNSRETRQQLLYVLQQQGRLREALAQRKRLARADPGDLDTGLALARELLQSGQRTPALAALERLARSTQGSGEAQAKVAEFYESAGESKRSQKLLERHARSRNRAALLALGERHFVRGDDAAAAQTWQSWVVGRSEEPQAWLELGRVLLDHDLLERGLGAFEQAHRLSGGRKRERRALALALERVGAAANAEEQRAARYRQAQSLWRQLGAEAESEGNPESAEEARDHLVTLWALAGTLSDQAQRLSAKLHAMPRDTTSRRLLAKVYARLGRPSEAEAELRTLLERAPHDSLLEDQLEQALVAQGNTESALKRLELRARREPERAQEYWQRMARYAARGHDEARALELSQKAAAQAPVSAVSPAAQLQALAQLAEQRLALGQLEAASDTYESLLRGSPRRHDLRLRAARLLLWQGQSIEALEQLLTISESAREQTLIRSAGELALAIASQEKKLEIVERRWLRSYVRRPTQAELRELLFDCYEAQLTEGTKRARGLHGARATKPLVDALQSKEAAERQRALRLLQQMPSQEANPALLRLAKSASTVTERAGAMLAATMSPDPASFASWASMTGATGQATVDPVARQATWALARANHPRARALLAPLRRHPSPELRTLAQLSYLDVPTQMPRLPQLWQPGYELPWAVGLWVQAKAGAPLPGGAELLLRSEDAVLHGTALLSLAIAEPERALEPIAAALLHPEATLRQAALGAACLLVARPGWERTQRAETAAPSTARAALRAQWPGGCSRAQRAEALERLLPALERAVRTRPNASGTMLTLAELLTGPNGEARLAPLLPADTPAQEAAGEALSHAPPPLLKQAKLNELLERVQRAALPSFLRAATSSDLRTRSAALHWLARRDESEALAGLLRGLHDPEPALRRQTLQALEGEERPEAAEALLAIASGPGPWHRRHAALEGLGQLSPRASRGVPSQPLARLAVRDPYAAVRREALGALCQLYARAALPVVERLRAHDAEPLVRQAAAAWVEALQ